jgi:uncharacterized coiled-coil protein SlyX
MKNQKIMFPTILIAAGCFAFLAQLQAVSPPPDGCYPGFTTAEGCGALNSLTTGAGNTGLGWRALFFNSTGSFNTGVGAGALILNNGDSNTAVGAVALLLNTSGTQNTAVGTDALVNNGIGSNNSALGAFALSNNIAGDYITALGANAGTDPGIVSNNVYIGDLGFGGDTNVIAIGALAASGTPYANCYIGGIATQSQVTDGVTVCEVSVRLSDGRLGIDCTHPSNPGSAPDSAPLRRSAPQQPQARPAIFNGKVGKVEKLEATVARLKATDAKQQAIIMQLKSNDAKQEATIAKQQRQIDSLTADLQRVSAQLQTNRPAAQVVANP